MKSQITCPNCQEVIDVNDVLTHQLEETIRKEFAAKQIEARKRIEQLKEALEKDKAAFLENKQKTEDDFQKRLQEQLQQSLLIKEKALKEKIALENSQQFEALNNELNEKSEQLKELNKSKAEIERLKREKNEMEDTIKAEQEKVFNQKLKEEQERLKKLADDAAEFKVKELKLQLKAQKELTEEMKRKQDQGSMQIQGEVLELAVEEWLTNQFPLDTIEEIKKGANGADCLQIVNTREMQNCGTIYYESKRTKAFQPSWIEKFKNDIRDKNANIGVLVTEVMPSDMERMGMREGVWICTFNEFKGLSAVLRQSIIELSRALVSQENKGDKMEMLYSFLTSNEFRLQIEGIVEGFTQMQDDLNREKNAMKRLWKQRENQIEKVIQNTLGMYGSIKGIAGTAIQEIKLLELDGQ